MSYNPNNPEKVFKLVGKFTVKSPHYGSFGCYKAKDAQKALDICQRMLLEICFVENAKNIACDIGKNLDKELSDFRSWQPMSTCELKGTVEILTVNSVVVTATWYNDGKEFMGKDGEEKHVGWKLPNGTLLGGGDCWSWRHITEKEKDSG